MVSQLSVLLMLSLFMTARTQKDCYSTDPNPFRRYTVITSYDDVRSKDVQEETIPGCSPIAVHMLIRHASRYPTSSVVESVNAVLPDLRQNILQNADKGRLCAEDLNALTNWTQRMVPSDDQRISDTGRVEAFETARRFQQRYPSLLRRPYDRNVFKFKHTDTQRNRESAIMFSVGLFNSSEGVVFDVASSTDRLLRYYKNCEKYDKTVLDAVNEEYNKFRVGPEMISTISDITARLGLNEIGLTLDKIYGMYQSCRFEHMIYRDAPWCAAFKEENLKHLEYYEDLKYWFEDSYPHNVTVEMACPLVEDLVTTFDNARQGSSVQSVFRFGHSPNVNTYLSRLGLYKDSTPLRADNYQEMLNRKWFTSKHDPMNGNVVLALYSCDDGEHRVKGFVNEKPVVMPGCGDTVCLYETLRTTWGPIASSCNMEEICRNFGTRIQSFQFLVVIWTCLLVAYRFVQ